MTHIFDLLVAQAALEPVTAPTLTEYMTAEGFVPVTGVFQVVLDGATFCAQKGRHTTKAWQRVYYAPVDDPGAIGWAADPQPEPNQ